MNPAGPARPEDRALRKYSCRMIWLYESVTFALPRSDAGITG